ncbi:MAG: thioredoxin domain-containing protein [Planctomycetes bacterium]|nr:thioredoxin domain-containing protein [Planctomycetota bacterium]
MTHSPRAKQNRLALETSPYLLQHAGNPVDWYPWGPEALERAKRESKPIFLSIGYSACHWCHVMERESFENDAIAGLMNEHFVNVKVDREERPDLDDIYMRAVQAMTGSGGWPMSVFLTPTLEPFYGGTYFPPSRMYGRPSFADVLESVARAWKQDREGVERTSQKLVEHIRRESTMEFAGAIDPGVLDLGFEMLSRNFDAVWGGFGDAPKFPHATDLRVVLRHWLRKQDTRALEMARLTLDRMKNGGIYDQLGGGFHRYSTDERWLIPHFEKMLYDNALLVPAYLEGYLATGEREYARIARECCEWALREMTTAEGAFASSQDADSEGEEGKFFVWTERELASVLGAKHGAWAAAWYGVTNEGNFEHGTSALWRNEPAATVAAKLHVDVVELERAIADARPKLFAARKQRIAPGTDDKVLVAWNGMMISALARAHQVLGEPGFLVAARRAATFVLTTMRRPDGGLHATARGTRAHLNAYLDDYAFLIQALLDLYESDFDARWVREAVALAAIVTQRFEDGDKGGFFTTASDHEQLLARLKSPQDGALPSGNGVHVHNLLRLAEFTGNRDYAAQAERSLVALGGLLNKFPAALGQMLLCVDFLAAGPREIVLAGAPGARELDDMLAAVRGRFLPQRVVALAAADADRALMPILVDRHAPAAGARAWVCRNYACRRPVDSARELLAELD